MKPVRAPATVLKTVDPSKYLMEKKYDGWRAIVIVHKTVTMWTRDKRRIDMPNNLRAQLETLGLPEGTILDGEIWNSTKRGSWRFNAVTPCNLTLWDVMRLGTKDLATMPLEERRIQLESLFAGREMGDIGLTEILPADPDLIKQIDQEARSFRENTHARSGFIHGVVLKRKGSPRRDHVVRCTEHADWLKIVFEGLEGYF